MDTLIQDARFALRSLRKSPGTTLVALISLGLGVGACTAIFSVVRTVLMESLPYREPGRLVRVFETLPARGIYTASVIPVNYAEWRARTDIFEGVAAYTGATRDLEGDEPAVLSGARATTNLFEVLGAQPLAGRTFVPSDEEPGAPPAAIVSEGLWRRRFGASPALLGSTIRLSGVPTMVIGIMPGSFDFPVSTTAKDFWIPIRWDDVGGITNTQYRALGVVARLAPGIDSATAMSRLSVLARQLEQAHPEYQEGRGIQVVGLTGTVTGGIRPALFVLMGGVGFVLLIVCANVANLMLARGASRRHELSVRAAIGATRGRLVRQLLTESVLLSSIGGLLGLALANLGLRALLPAASTVLPSTAGIGLDVGALLFAVGVTLVVGLAVGIVPAVRISQVDLRPAHAESGTRSTSGAHGRGLLDGLVIAELSLSLVLLVGAGLLIRSFGALLAVDLGFEPDRVLVFRVAPPSGERDASSWQHFHAPVLERVRAIPGVRAAGAINRLPIQDGTEDRYFSIVGRSASADLSELPSAQIRAASAQYFRAMGIPILAGREFDARDGPLSEPVVIVNDELVRRYFPGQSPIGRQLEGAGRPVTIVGVVASARQVGLDQSPRPEFYLSAAQSAYGFGGMAFAVSTFGPPEAIVPSVRAAIDAVAPGRPLSDLATMNQVIGDSIATRTLMLTLLGGFAVFALALAAVGIFGVISHDVSRRTAEIGIRMALGARPVDVGSMVLRDVARLTLIGAAVGLAGAAVLTRVLGSLLYEVGPHDPVTFAVVPVVIILAAFAAGAIPARRMARLDPLRAIRSG